MTMLSQHGRESGAQIVANKSVDTSRQKTQEVEAFPINIAASGDKLTCQKHERIRYATNLRFMPKARLMSLAFGTLPWKQTSEW